MGEQVAGNHGRACSCELLVGGSVVGGGRSRECIGDLLAPLPTSGDCECGLRLSTCSGGAQPAAGCGIKSSTPHAVSTHTFGTAGSSMVCPRAAPGCVVGRRCRGLQDNPTSGRSAWVVAGWEAPVCAAAGGAPDGRVAAPSAVTHTQHVCDLVGQRNPMCMCTCAQEITSAAVCILGRLLSAAVGIMP
jgi:hypothetical protein